MKNRVFSRFVSAILLKPALLAALFLCHGSELLAEGTSLKPMDGEKPFYTVNDGDRRFLVEVLLAVKRQDVGWIAAHAQLPMVAGEKRGSKRKIITTQKQLKLLLTGKLTPALLKEMQEAAKEPLFVNYQGVMLGDGILWFYHPLNNDSTAAQHWILAFGNLVWQP